MSLTISGNISSTSCAINPISCLSFFLPEFHTYETPLNDCIVFNAPPIWIILFFNLTSDIVVDAPITSPSAWKSPSASNLNSLLLI